MLNRINENSNEAWNFDLYPFSLSTSCVTRDIYWQMQRAHYLCLSERSYSVVSIVDHGPPMVSNIIY